MPDKTTAAHFAVTHFAGRAGDHTDRAMRASGVLATELASHLDAAIHVIGEAAPALNASWQEELDAALPDLTRMREHYDGLLASGQTPVTALSRCAVAVATLPAVAHRRPDAVVVWFDAHADLHTPASTTTGYLGGMALSGPLGSWDSGLGAGLSPRNAILAGTRDIDAGERALIDSGDIIWVAPGPDFAERLADAIAGRPVYVHIDCDVLEPNTVPTDYLVTGGLTLADLKDALTAIEGNRLIGLEIGELEATETAEGTRAAARRIIQAVTPLLRA